MRGIRGFNITKALSAYPSGRSPPLRRTFITPTANHPFVRIQRSCVQPSLTRFFSNLDSGRDRELSPNHATSSGEGAETQGPEKVSQPLTSDHGHDADTNQDEKSRAQLLIGPPDHKSTKKSGTHGPGSGHKLFDGSAIGSATKHYTEEINRAYSELEKNLMQRINESNQRRFRIILLSTVLFITWVVAVFGTRIRKMLSDQTAGLAKETLENESLKVQTQELAMAVVNTVLNDKEVTAHAASFLREASVVPETQQALLQLTLHVLQHPDTLHEATTLAKKLITVLAKDKVGVIWMCCIVL